MQHEWEAKRIQGLSSETCKKKYNLDDLSLDGRTILKCVLKKWDGRV
jgi:hypothetical protein